MSNTSPSRVLPDGDADTDYPRQLDRLAAVDWDVLIILDALRWDIWADMVGVGEPVWSPGNCTPQWVRAAHRHPDIDFSDVVCLTANPEVTRHTFENLYADRDDLWDRKWEYINGVGTVPPAAVTEAAQARLTVGPDRPVYAHYAQPHGPYPRHDPPIPVMRNNPMADDVQHDADRLPDEIVMNPTGLLNDPDSWLSAEMLRDAYRANIEWVWEAIQPLLDGWGTVVVTSDHGEILGESLLLRHPDGELSLRYGHPPAGNHHLLRRVPFAVFD